jgi:hypothetical protein
MSTHYTFVFNAHLHDWLTQSEIRALEYIFEGTGSPPAELPSHDFFQPEGISMEAFWRGNDLHSQPRPIAHWNRLWTDRDPISGAARARGVNIFQNGIKDSWWSYAESFGLICWLASLSLEQGLVGSLVAEDAGPERGAKPKLFYVFDKELHMQATPGEEIHSVISSNERAKRDGNASNR